MKLSNIINFLLLVIAITLGACNDFFEKDITKKEITVYTPTDKSTSSSAAVTFTWEKVKGALKYQLQAVKGSFSNVQSFVFDSTVTTQKLSWQFNPGNYEWRIKAINGSSETRYFSFSFSVDSTLDIKNQTPILQSPANNSYSNNLTQTFNWYSVPNATEYRLDIYDSTSALITTQNIQNALSYSYTFSSPGVYRWRVQARNDISLSNYSGYYYITIKTTPASVSTPLTPKNDSIVSVNPLALKWTREALTVADSIMIDTSSTFSSNPIPYRFYYTGTQGPSTINTIVTITNPPVSGTKLYWRLKSKDNAGNWSGYSSKQRFKVN